jgi:hypothetical protein
MIERESPSNAQMLMIYDLGTIVCILQVLTPWSQLRSVVTHNNLFSHDFLITHLFRVFSLTQKTIAKLYDF